MSSTTVPSLKVKSNVRSISGMILSKYALNALESLAKNLLSINSLIVFCVRSPFTDCITCFKRVVNSGDEFLLIFLSPFSSCSISLSFSYFFILLFHMFINLSNVKTS